MGSGADAARQNWDTLKRLAGLSLARLRQQNPGWNFSDLERHVDLPRTKLMRELAEEAGFDVRNGPSSVAENKVLRSMLRGILCPRRIAQETKLTLRQVKQVLRRVGTSYGVGAYGGFPWPGKRVHKANDARARSQPRRVSSKGQFSYNGRTYGLGSPYAGRVCWVEEAVDRLLVHFADVPSVTLRKRSGKGLTSTL